MKIYKNITNSETVHEEDAEYYAMEQLGITVTPKGNGGALTEEQTEFKTAFTEWYFSGNWVEEEDKEVY